LLIRNKSISVEKLNQLYQQSWKSPVENLGETGATTPDLARQYIDQLQESLGIQSIAGLNILDFGAGRGTISILLKEFGANVCAMEPYGYEYLESQGFTVFRDLAEIPSGMRFDGVVSIDVVEHLQFPWIDLKTIRDFLAPGGWFFLSTPNQHSLNARITGSRWREATRDGHLFLFTDLSLVRMLKDLHYANVQVLRWKVRYSANPLVQMKDRILLSLGLDGELRVLAYQK
jgi:SAM-dependent methyltransferase